MRSGLYQQLLDRIGPRLEGWKTKLLSLAGRHVLAQSVLTSIPPLYHMQSALLPILGGGGGGGGGGWCVGGGGGGMWLWVVLLVWLCNQIHKVVRQFMWGSMNERKRIHLLNWDTIARTREQGGLGIKKVHQMNLAMLVKIGWRLIVETESLWAKVIRGKYIREEMNTSKFTKKQNSSNAWNGIVPAAGILDKKIKVNAYNGKYTMFWRDKWLEDRPLLDDTLWDIPESESYKTIQDYWEVARG